MAAVKFDTKVRDLLLDAYIKRYGRSPSRLIKALNAKYSDELGHIRSEKGAEKTNLISDKTIRNFFGDTPPLTLHEATLNYLCGLLTEYPSYQDALEDNFDVSLIVPTALTSYQQYVKEFYGKIKVLDMREPVPLKRLYIESRLSENLRSEQQHTLDSLQEVLDIYKPSERLTKDEESISAKDALKQYSRLVILGNAGAGKTTLLRYLLNEYVEQYPQRQDILPVYVSLNDFSDSLEYTDLFDYISVVMEQFIPKQNLAQMAASGRILFLIDGLDEVRDENVRDIQRKIWVLVKKYVKSGFVIACRSAARDRTTFFNNFKTMEIMDLNLDQIQQFAENWFKGSGQGELDPQNAVILKQEAWQSTVKKFTSQLKGNLGAQELAQTSLLLTMLCYVFQDNYNLPKNKHALYGDAVDALLRRWDSTRRIERNEVYGEKLSRDRKINMLGEISHRALRKPKGKLFWQKDDIKREIAEYITNIPGIGIQETLDVNSGKVLYELSANNGLLLEDGRNVYRFTHRTVQEYFAARYILESNQRETYLQEAVNQYLLDRSWREVFPIIAGRLTNGDSLLQNIFHNAYQVIEDDDEVQAMLEWLDGLTIRYKLPYVGWRAFFLAVDLETLMYIAQGSIKNSKDAHAISQLVSQYNEDSGGTRKPTSEIRLTLNLVIVQTLANDKAKKGQADYKPIEGYVAEYLIENRQLKTTLDIAIQLANDLEKLSLVQELERLASSLPIDELDFSAWDKWAKQLNTVTVDKLDVGRDVELSPKSKENLQKYLYACSILMDCVQGDSYASKDVRENLVNSLLLPKAKTYAALKS